mmetsp:Transcript_31440/g.47007  ORF Transcript_31440/g.47007 Transcript_31440/m.47007 type:complete len:200 (+) Transcript_31440:127-726(+)
MPMKQSLKPAKATTESSSLTNSRSFIDNMIGLAKKTPSTLTAPKPKASGIIGSPRLPPITLIGNFPTFKKQKNIARVPTYDCGVNSAIDKRYTLRIGPIELVSIVAIPPTRPTEQAQTNLFVGSIDAFRLVVVIFLSPAVVEGSSSLLLLSPLSIASKRTLRSFFLSINGMCTATASSSPSSSLPSSSDSLSFSQSPEK